MKTKNYVCIVEGNEAGLFIINNLSRWCIENNINYNKLYKTISTHKFYEGYRLEKNFGHKFTTTKEFRPTLIIFDEFDNIEE